MNKLHLELTSQQTIRLAELHDVLANTMPDDMANSVMYPVGVYPCDRCGLACVQSCSGSCVAYCSENCQYTCSSSCAGDCFSFWAVFLCTPVKGIGGP